MYRIISILLLAILILGEALAENEEEIIVADLRVDWRGYPAFYIEAPPSLASSMESAIRTALSDDPELCRKKANIEWICSEIAHRFFVGVSGDGKELLSGYACGQSFGIPRLKYYREDLVAYSPCVALDWDEETRMYDVYEADEDGT